MTQTGQTDDGVDTVEPSHVQCPKPVGYSDDKTHVYQGLDHTRVSSIYGICD